MRAPINEQENLSNTSVKQMDDAVDKRIATINPLEITLILNLVLSCLTLKHLLKCRLVNRTWNLTAVPWIHQKQTKRMEIKSEDFPWFCMSFVKCKLFPLSKLEFILHGMNLSRGGVFFVQHGFRILDLKIKDFEGGTQIVGSNEEIKEENLIRLQHILKHVPNLKTLSLHIVLFPKRLSDFIFDQNELLRVSLSEVTSLKLISCSLLRTSFLDGLFEMFPNAKGITFGLVDSVRQGEFVTRAVQKLAHHFEGISSLRSCERLGLWRAICSSQKLKGLSVFIEIGIKVEAQEELLKSQSESLQYLTLCSSRYNETSNENSAKLKLPVLRNVRKLSFTLNDHILNPDQTPFPMVPIEPDQLPRLDILHVWSRILELGTFVNSAFTSVREIEIYGNGVNCEQLLADRFPNLKKLKNLKTNLGTTQMELIATSWPDLEVLEMRILGGPEQIYNFNKVVSGVSVDFEGRIGLELLKSFIGPRRPSLGDMKNLKKLVLNFDTQGSHQYQYFYIDQVGVYLTFLRLSRHLRIYFKGEFRIPHELVALLTAHYQHIYFFPYQRNRVV